MSDNFIRSIYVGRHAPHRFININIRTDIKPEQISLWNLGVKSLTNIPFHKGYLCSEPFMKRTLFKKLRFNKINIENIETKERRFNIYSY